MKYIYRIEKGDRFLCLKNFVMTNGQVAYIEGKIYTSDRDGYLPDESPEILHQMDGVKEFFDYFKLIE
jgi:hypothetical protein